MQTQAGVPLTPAVPWGVRGGRATSLRFQAAADHCGVPSPLLRGPGHRLDFLPPPGCHLSPLTVGLLQPAFTVLSCDKAGQRLPGTTNHELRKKL